MFYLCIISIKPASVYCANKVSKNAINIYYNYIITL